MRHIQAKLSSSPKSFVGQFNKHTSLIKCAGFSLPFTPIYCIIFKSEPPDPFQTNSTKLEPTWFIIMFKKME